MRVLTFLLLFGALLVSTLAPGAARAATGMSHATQPSRITATNLFCSLISDSYY